VLDFIMDDGSTLIIVVVVYAFMCMHVYENYECMFMFMFMHVYTLSFSLFVNSSMTKAHKLQLVTLGTGNNCG
jgi:hypothetical protein